jgi:hypothetical protein
MKMWDQMSTGKPDRSLFTTEMNAAMTPELMASAVPGLQGLGKLENLPLIDRTSVKGGTSYLYSAQFSSGHTGSTSSLLRTAR